MTLNEFYALIIGEGVDIIPSTPSALADVMAYGNKAHDIVSNAITTCGGKPCGKYRYRFADGECFIFFLD